MNVGRLRYCWARGPCWCKRDVADLHVCLYFVTYKLRGGRSSFCGCDWRECPLYSFLFIVGYKDGVSIGHTELMVIKGMLVAVVRGHLITLHFRYSSLVGKFDELKYGRHVDLHRNDPVRQKIPLYGRYSS